jgi:hypothetical protein
MIGADQYYACRREAQLLLPSFTLPWRLRDLTAWGKPSPIRSRKGSAIGAITASHTLPLEFQAPHHPLGAEAPRVLEKAYDETRLQWLDSHASQVVCSKASWNLR